jgi:hypothetical protein
MMPSLKYKFLEKIYDINSNLLIHKNRVDTSELSLEISLKDLRKISIISFTYFVIISLMFIKTQTFYYLDYLMCIFSYLLTFSIALFYTNALKSQALEINNFRIFHKYLFTFLINISSLAKLVFINLTSHTDNLYFMQHFYLELFYIFFLTVLLKLDDHGYGMLWIFNFLFVHFIGHTKLADLSNFGFEKLFCLALCVCSILINQDSGKKILKNYIIHKKTQRYIDHLISEMFCLFFAWNDNKFVYVNQTAKKFINNKYEINPGETPPDDDNYNLLSKSK